MTSLQKLIPIPQPPKHGYGFLGNVPDIDRKAISPSYGKLVALYGPIFRLDLLSKTVTILASQELINEICNETRFTKQLGTLRQVRIALGDGMITALTNEHNWKLAHKLLIPSFGPMAVRAMFPQMLDIISQMILKWERLGPCHAINVSDNFTRLTLDIIGLTGFNHRFNSFYSDEEHPFVSSLMGMLWGASKTAMRSKLENLLRYWSRRDFKRHTETLHKLCDGIIKDRRDNPKDVNDMLNIMLLARDPETGEGLSDENIRYQVETLLAAGHETTSALLSFTIYELLQNPSVLAKAQLEVDTILGTSDLHAEHLPQLHYLDAILKETLRLHPPAAQICMSSNSGPGILAGRYAYTESDIFILDLVDLHRDPTVWGTDALTFRPERMLNGGFEKLPPNAWKPWGNGVRACVGRDFAMQDALMTVALILRRFRLCRVLGRGEVIVEQTVTQKPVGLFIRAEVREGKDSEVRNAEEGWGKSGSGRPALLRRRTTLTTTTQIAYRISNTEQNTASGPACSLAVLYGSNSGTCKAFAEDMASEGSSLGFCINGIQTLDSISEKIPVDRPILIIAPSYEGRPSDDSKKFVSWLERIAGSQTAGDSAGPAAHEGAFPLLLRLPLPLHGVRYSVLGVGNTNWVNTYQRIPRLIDGLMERLGGQRIVGLEEANVAGDVYGAFDEWAERVWGQLCSGKRIHSPTESKELGIEIVANGQVARGLDQESLTGPMVHKNEVIASGEFGYVKMHMEIELPECMTYSTGDYIVVQPTNGNEAVQRVLRRFSIAADACILLQDCKKSYLPTKPEHAHALLARYVELHQPISRKQLNTLSECIVEKDAKTEIDRLTHEGFEEDILAKRTSVIDVLETFPTCSLPFARFIDMLQPLKPRQYSVSSSPLASTDKHLASITYDVVTAPALSNQNRIFNGVGTGYLSALQPGNRVNCAVRSTSSGFRLPLDNTVPIIMIAAGTGIAPMRGFLQERAAIAKLGGAPLGKAIFYYGCRHPDMDYLYKNELLAWQEMGVMEMRPCFSCCPDQSQGFKHVPQRIWQDRGELKALFNAGAKILVCGSANKLVKSTADICARIYMEVKKCSLEKARAWLEEVKSDRYVSDTFY